MILPVYNFSVEFYVSAAEHDAGNPFFPFDGFVKERLSEVGGISRALRQVPKLSQARRELLHVFLRTDFSDHLRQLILLEPASRFLRPVIHDCIRIITKADEKGPQHTSLHISIKNACFLPPAFSRFSEQVIAACQAENIAVSIELDCWMGDPLHDDIIVHDVYGGCCLEQKMLVNRCPVYISMEEMLRVYASNTIDAYYHRFAQTVLAKNVPNEERIWACLILMRSSEAERFLPKISAILLQPESLDPELAFVFNLAVAVYYYAGRFTAEAAQYLNQAYRYVIEQEHGFPEIHPQILQFFYLSKGNVALKDREFHHEPSIMFFQCGLSLNTSGSELLEIHLRLGLAYYLAVESMFEKAHSEVSKVIAMAKQRGYEEEIFEARRIIGAIYQMQGNYPAALANLQQALYHSVEYARPLDVAIIHNTIAHIKLSQGQYASCLHHLLRAAEVLISDFEREYIEEITNTYDTMVELAFFSGNLLWALKLLRINSEFADFFFAKRAERHISIVQNTRYLTYVYWRLDNISLARKYLSRFTHGIRNHDHFINAFEVERLSILLQESRVKDQQVARAVKMLEPYTNDTVYARILLLQFYLDLYRKTGEERWKTTAGDYANLYQLNHIFQNYNMPAAIDWGVIERRTPSRLLQSYVSAEKQLRSSSETLNRYNVVHEFSQRIINATGLDQIIEYLIPIIISQLEADVLYLYLPEEEGCRRIRRLGDEKRASEGCIDTVDDPVFTWAEMAAADSIESTIVVDTIDHNRQEEIPDGMKHRSILINRLPSLNRRSGMVIAANAEHSHWRYSSEDMNILSNLMDLFSLKLQNLAYIQQLAEKSQLDDLTGVYNKSLLEPFMRELTAAYRRNSSLFSMIVLDGDNFKRINDNYGHQYGDTAIRKTAETIQQSIRENDRLLRFGGDEFVIFLPETALDDAMEIAERIRSSLEKGICTASLGVGEYSDRYSSTDRFFESVDRALYEAKRSKNTVVAVPLSQSMNRVI